jgi:hypothetical protein
LSDSGPCSAADRIDITGLAFNAHTTKETFTLSGAFDRDLNVFVGSTQMASSHLFGQVATSIFIAQSDGAGGTLILDPPNPSQVQPAVGH